MSNFVSLFFGLFEGLVNASQALWSVASQPINVVLGFDLLGNWDNATLIEFTLLSSAIAYIGVAIYRFIFVS